MRNKGKKMVEITSSWEFFIEQHPQFMKLMRELGKHHWYTQRGWVMFIGQYHAGIYAQIYKSNWFNYTLDGVHLETGMTPESLVEKKLQIDLHVGHRNLFDRVKFNEYTIPKMQSVIETWEIPYKFSTKNLSERLSIWVPFTKSAFAKKVSAGFAQMSTLGSIIDEGISQL
jgi:hypothetical protein